MGSLSGLAEHDVTVTSFEVVDLRFPTSLTGVGSDAMHVGTNGSHPYIRLETNKEGLVGEGIVSTTRSFRKKECNNSFLSMRTGIQQRPRQRTRLRSPRNLRKARGRQDDARNDPEHGQDLAVHGLRLAIQMARAREEHHAPGRVWSPECSLGSVGEDPGQAGLEDCL